MAHMDRTKRAVFRQEALAGSGRQTLGRRHTRLLWPATVLGETPADPSRTRDHGPGAVAPAAVQPCRAEHGQNTRSQWLGAIADDPASIETSTG
jgi:hypothetical protein